MTHNSPVSRPSMRAFFSRFRPYFISAALFSLLVNLLMLVPALFMLQVFDRVVTSRSTETLIMLLVIAMGALVFMAFFDIIRARLLSASAVSLEKHLGPRVLVDMIRSNANPEGAKDLNGLRDVNSLRAFLTGPGIIALFDSPWVPIYVLIIFLFHPLMGWVALGGAILLLCFAILNEKLSRQPLEAMQAESRKAGRFADQSFINAEVARALGMEDNLTRGWSNFSRKGLEKQLQASRFNSAFTSITKATRQLLQVGMMSTGAWLVIHQEATLGIMIAGTILMGRALAPVEMAIGAWKGLVEARSAYGRLNEMLSNEPDEEGLTELPAPKGDLSLERVVFGFRGQDRPVIKQISFHLEPGESLAIVGPSAAGKSTLARLIVGLWKPSMGVVRLDGADIAIWPRQSLGPYVGYLPQNVELFAGTVSENIARMGAVDSPSVINAAKRAGAHEMILRLPQGYDTFISEGGAFLSAGQRQRVALARALYGKPCLVILDEPNSNLDAEGETALVNAIQGINADGITLIVITHRARLLSTVNKILLLRDGVIEKFGPASELLQAMGLRPPAENQSSTTKAAKTLYF